MWSGVKSIVYELQGQISSLNAESNKIPFYKHTVSDKYLFCESYFVETKGTYDRVHNTIVNAIADKSFATMEPELTKRIVANHSAILDYILRECKIISSYVSFYLKGLKSVTDVLEENNPNSVNFCVEGFDDWFLATLASIDNFRVDDYINEPNPNNDYISELVVVCGKISSSLALLCSCGILVNTKHVHRLRMQSFDTDLFIHSLLLRDIQITSVPCMPPTPHARSAHRPIKATFAPAKAYLPDASAELSIFFSVLTSKQT